MKPWPIDVNKLKEGLPDLRRQKVQPLQDSGLVKEAAASGLPSAATASGLAEAAAASEVENMKFEEIPLHTPGESPVEIQGEGLINFPRVNVRPMKMSPMNGHPYITPKTAM